MVAGQLLQVGALVLQVAILATLVVGIRRKNASVVVNSLVALLAALLPSLVAFSAENGFANQFTVSPFLSLWVAAAGFLHALGMLGYYDDTWWWDHLTHTLSASLIAALLYAGLIVVARNPNESIVANAFVAPLTVLSVFVIGVFWEVLELFGRTLAERFDLEPVLINYGPADTAYDLVFDVVGALLVVGLDVRVFVQLAETHPGATRQLVYGTGGAVLVGTMLMAAVVVLDGNRRPNPPDT